MATQIREIESKGEKIEVIYEESDYLPIVSMQLVFRDAGKLSESINGLAGLSASLLNEGTKALGSVGFASKLDAKAISLYADVGRESFVIEVSALKSEFPTAMEYLYELLGDPNYTQEALDHIKHQKLGWLNQKKSDFNHIASTNLRKMLFEGSPLAEPYEGTQESIKSIKLADIESFLQSHLGVNNLMVVVGGDIAFEQIEGYLNKLTPLLGHVEPLAMKPIKASAKRETVLLEEETQQAFIFFGAPFDYSYRSNDQHLAKITEYLLGGAGFGSRLMEEIRVKRGLTYGVYASLRQTKSVSYLSGYMQTKLSTQEEAKEVIIDVVAKFLEEGITQKELEDTKKFLLGSQPLRTETLSQRLNRAFNDYYYERELDFSKHLLEQIERVKLEEVNAFIASHKELLNLSFSIVTNKEAMK
jgi:zinc protease